MAKDYSKTVNLPKTDFSMKANLPVREPEIISLWQKNKTYQKLCRENNGKQKFILHDGPPYANGEIHIGHALNKILKDIIVKYKSLKGYYSPFINGWDCHGLPIEYQLFKELKKDKRQIGKIEFRSKAREFAAKFVEIQKADFIRLGVWADWDSSYLTMSHEYESTIVGVFKMLVSKGYIYRSKKPIHWCPDCETALAEAEVEYDEHTSPSIYVKFPIIQFPSKNSLKEDAGSSVLIWTTTPWTLPANVALAFHPQHEYVNVKCKAGNFIVAKVLLENITKSIGINNYEITHTFKGSELEGIKCRNPVASRESVGILADFVSTEEGTGVVHVAPGHGMEDYSIGLKYKLPVISPVDSRGRFTDEVPEFQGKKVFDANQPIIEKLESSGLLLYLDKIVHSYPHCWRCRKPVIFRATEQWFLNVEHNNTRSKMMNSINAVKWVPSYMRNRMKSMVQFRPDWCLSRQRYWGVPIPVVYCNRCNKPLLDVRIIEKFEKVVKSEGSDAWFTHPLEDFIPSGIKCECGNDRFNKEEDILDVWFDSGVSHEAVLKNPKLELRWPADIYLEGSDQHRGWFQTSLIPAVALYGKAPYKTVITHGFVVDSEGHKMSKSLGNVIAPQEVVEKHGAEILRLWACSSNYSEDVKISKEIISRLTETYRKIRNTIRFALGNIYDFNPAGKKAEYSELWEIDRWILHRLQGLVKDVTEAYENYQFHSVISEVNKFCVLDLSSFYFDILKDRLYTFRRDSKDRRAAQTVLYEILNTILPLIAPMLSFTAEESWQCLGRIEANKEDLLDSVFLKPFPFVNEQFISKDLEARWLGLLLIRDKVNLEIETKRKEGLIGSSLESKVILTIKDRKTYELWKKHYIDGSKDSLKTIFIVSQVELKFDENLKEHAVRILHADGKKCPRCWNWFVDDTGEICGRCRDAINE